MKPFWKSVIGAAVTAIVGGIIREVFDMGITDFKFWGMVCGLLYVASSLTWIFYLTDRLRRFNRAVTVQLNHLLRHNQIVNKYAPQIKDEMWNELEISNQHNPNTPQEFDDLYIFDKDNPFKNRIQ